MRVFLLSIVLLVMILNLPGYTDNPTIKGEDRFFLFDFGAGIVSFNKDRVGGLSGDFDFVLEKGDRLLTIRYALSGVVIHFTDPPVWTSEVALLYGGKFIFNNYMYTSLSAGLSHLRGVRLGQFIGYKNGDPDLPQYKSILYSTVGMPIDIKFFFSPFPFSGEFVRANGTKDYFSKIGLKLSGNLNDQQSYSRMMIISETIL